MNTQTRYIFRTLLQDLRKRKFGVFLAIVVIAMSLTIPTISYLLWKNISQAAAKFYPEPELTIYLHKNLAEQDIKSVVDQVRQYDLDKIEHINYISRQQSLEEFRAWSGFGHALDILDDNPLPAVVILKPKKSFIDLENMTKFRDDLQRIKGVQEVRIDNGFLEKLNALSQLIARIGSTCALLMVLAVFLVIGNSVRSDVSNHRASINIMRLLGATDYFVSRPFLYKGMFYGASGGLLAIMMSSLIINYFTSVVRYVSDMFTVKFELHSFTLGEMIFLVTLSIFLGWLSAKIATNHHIQKLN